VNVSGIRKYIFTQKNLEQSKYQNLMDKFKTIGDEVGFDVIELSNDKIEPVSELTDDSQKLVIFDDSVYEKNQKPLIDHFTRAIRIAVLFI